MTATAAVPTSTVSEAATAAAARAAAGEELRAPSASLPRPQAVLATPTLLPTPIDHFGGRHLSQVAELGIHPFIPCLLPAHLDA